MVDFQLPNSIDNIHIDYEYRSGVVVTAAASSRYALTRLECQTINPCICEYSLHRNLFLIIITVCLLEYRSRVLLQHRCCDAASPGSVRNSGINANSCYKSYPSVYYHKKVILCVCSAVQLCFWLTDVKGNIKNQGLAMGQDPCDPKYRGPANHPAFISIFII